MIDLAGATREACGIVALVRFQTYEEQNAAREGPTAVGPCVP